MTQNGRILLALVALCSAVRAQSVCEINYPIVDEKLKCLGEEFAAVTAKQHADIKKIEAELENAFKLCPCAVVTPPSTTNQPEISTKNPLVPKECSTFSIITINPGEVTAATGYCISKTLEDKKLLKVGMCLSEHLITALGVAVLNGDLYCMEVLLRSKYDKNAIISALQTTVVMLAAASGQTNALCKLIAVGANVHARDQHAYTALHWAAYNDQSKVIAPLVAAGVNVNAKDKEKNTPLIVASSFGSAVAIRALLAAGANVNAQGLDKNTALMLASFYKHAGAVLALLEAKPDHQRRNVYGKTALDIARVLDNSYIVSLLLEYERENVIG